MVRLMNNRRGMAYFRLGCQNMRKFQIKFKENVTAVLSLLAERMQ